MRFVGWWWLLGAVGLALCAYPDVADAPAAAGAALVVLAGVGLQRELQRRHNQQQAVAHFGRRALDGVGPEELMAEATGVLAAHLDRIVTIAPGRLDGAGVTDEPGRLSVRIGTPERGHGEVVIASRRGRRSSTAHLPFVESVANVLAQASERDRIAQDVRQSGFHDPLTQLPDSELLRDRLDQALARSGRAGAAVGLLVIDLDGFKQVNESLGHRIGDLLLIAVAQRMTAVLRAQDTLARSASDEFVVVCEDMDHDLLTDVARRLEDAIARPLVIEGVTLSMTVSIGVVIATDGPAGADELLRDAELAMQRAKDLGGGRFELHDDVLRAQQNHRQRVHRALELAPVRGELELAYQPLVALGNEPLSPVAGDVVVGVEALLRWRHPVEGWMVAEEFLPIAESSRLIIPVGEWALHQSCRQLARWRRLAPDGQPFTVFVNLSARHLADRMFVAGLLDSLEETGADPRGLGVEVGEAVLRSNDDEAIATLEALTALGVRLAIDDFGSAHSTIAELRRLPVHYVKIDVAAPRGGIDRAFVSSVTGMARELGIAVVAEGVETERQLEVVRELGCDFAQGFHIAHPTHSTEIDALLGDGRRVRPDV